MNALFLFEGLPPPLQKKTKKRRKKTTTKNNHDIKTEEKEQGAEKIDKWKLNIIHTHKKQNIDFFKGAWS